MLALRRSFQVSVLLLCAAAVAAPEAQAEEKLTRLPVPADLQERDEWVGIYIQGTKCGWGHMTRRRTAKDGPWSMTWEMRTDLTSFGQASTIVQRGSTVFDAKPPHALLSASHETDQAGQKRKVALERKDGAYVATITTAGEPREMKLDALDFTLGDEIAPEIWCAQGPEVGAAIRVRTFDVGDLESKFATITVLAEETVVAGGVPIRYRTLNRRDSDGLEGKMRVDADGNVLSMSIGSFAEVRLEPEEVAKQTEVSSDLFVLGMVRIDQPIGTAPKVAELVVGVTGDDTRALADGPRQRIERDAETGLVTLSIGKAHGVAEKPTKEEIADALAETADYPVKNPKVVALAKQAVGDAKSDRDKVARLVAFVSEYVEDALSDSLSVEHIIEKKKGDCTEHAALFTAVARAAGVPCREVSGLMYVGDEMRAFGGHAWNEVVLDGVWVPVDPAWNQTETDAAHVRLGAGEDSHATMLKTFGKLSFQLRSVKHEE